MNNQKRREQATAQVFLLNLDDIDITAYRQCYEMVSSKRRERADRYYKYEDALRCVMSEILVRYVYHYIRKSRKLPQFVYPSRGKPYLSNDLAFHFSVSHTGMWIAVGYTEGQIGIDIEQIDRPLDRKKIAASVFTPKEQMYIFGASEKQICNLRFAEIWTAKESYLKYLGYGFGKSPLSFSINLQNKTVMEKEKEIIPQIALLGNHLSEQYYLTVCGNVEKLSLIFTTYHSIMDSI